MYDDVPDRSMKKKTLIQTAVIMGGLIVAGCAAFAVVWGAATARSTATSEAGGAHNGEPKTTAEKEIAAWIESYPLQIGEDVQWIEWGPNDEDGTQTTHAAAGKYTVIRVRYSAKPRNQPRTIRDTIFQIDTNVFDVNPLDTKPPAQDDSESKPRSPSPPLRGVCAHDENFDGANWLKNRAAQKKAEEKAAMSR